MTSAVAHAQLDVPERGRREDLATHQLTRAQTLDELGELALGTQPRRGGQPADVEEEMLEIARRLGSPLVLPVSFIIVAWGEGLCKVVCRC